jgi:hypothetical protein
MSCHSPPQHAAHLIKARKGKFDEIFSGYRARQLSVLNRRFEDYGRRESSRT